MVSLFLSLEISPTREWCVCINKQRQDLLKCYLKMAVMLVGNRIIKQCHHSFFNVRAFVYSYPLGLDIHTPSS